MAKVNLIIKTFKVPIIRDKEGKVDYKQVPITKDMFVEEKPIEDDGSVFVKLPQYSKEVANYNLRQIKYAEEDTRIDYINKRVITKE